MDAVHRFEAHKLTPVSGNTAAMLGDGGMSWLSPHFKVLSALQMPSCYLDLSRHVHQLINLRKRNRGLSVSITVHDKKLEFADRGESQSALWSLSSAAEQLEMLMAAGRRQTVMSLASFAPW